MKKFYLLLMAVLFITAPFQVFAQTTTWKMDKAHTSVKFEVEHLTVSFVFGQFMEFDGSAVSDKSDFTDAKVDFTVQTKTVNTNVEMRDQDLRSPRFLDVEQYPQMKFKSKAVKKLSKGKYVLTGYLTIKDVAKLVNFDVTYKGTVTDPWGNTRAGCRAILVINRFDYNVNYKVKFGNNALDVAPEVKIIIDTEFTKNK
jgi:polyisoprenoid-binding protein YceI